MLHCEQVPQRILLTLLADRVIAFGFGDQTLQAEFILQLLVPLLAQVAHFVSKKHTARKGIAAGEEGRIDLMRIEINLRVDQR